ncbi:orotidine-5'-phosphate decarboxylase [Candidatus Kaiserbacteria bacterium]|nr:orotidine-5'-phosphate decarboxylase [Candidatus Kaiserbacteria bacterium]
MARKPKLVLAWDKSTHTPEDDALLCKLLREVDMLKLGLRAMNAEDADCRTIASIVRRRIWNGGFRAGVFWDAKLDDIEQTVVQALKHISYEHCRMVTLHATISNSAMRAAVAACKGRGLLPVAVTVLTDLSQAECYSRFGNVPNIAVLNFARMVKANGIKAITCSAQELAYLRPIGVLDGMVTVVPGIQAAWSKHTDQKRTVTPAQAVALGADYLVVGRSILDPPDGMTPVEAARKIRSEMNAALAS